MLIEDRTKFYTMGYGAHLEGTDRSHNPFRFLNSSAQMDNAFQEWFLGWDQAQEDKKKKE